MKERDSIKKVRERQIKFISMTKSFNHSSLFHHIVKICCLVYITQGTTNYNKLWHSKEGITRETSSVTRFHSTIDIVDGGIFLD